MEEVSTIVRSPLVASQRLVEFVPSLLLQFGNPRSSVWSSSRDPMLPDRTSCRPTDEKTRALRGRDRPGLLGNTGRKSFHLRLREGRLDRPPGRADNDNRARLGDPFKDDVVQPGIPEVVPVLEMKPPRDRPGPWDLDPQAAVSRNAADDASHLRDRVRPASHGRAFCLPPGWSGPRDGPCSGSATASGR